MAFLQVELHVANLKKRGFQDSAVSSANQWPKFDSPFVDASVALRIEIIKFRL